MLLLSWVGIGMFRSDPTNSQSQSPTPVPAPREAAPVVGDEPVPKAATATAETIPAEAKPVESAVREQPGAPPLPLNQVIPDVSQSARETIRGTIIVSIRVIVGKDGTVLAATADDPGPSRYFERLAVEASKKWTFTPAKREQRAMLVRFYFTRAGTTARATPL